MRRQLKHQEAVKVIRQDRLRPSPQSVAIGIEKRGSILGTWKRMRIFGSC